MKRHSLLAATAMLLAAALPAQAQDDPVFIGHLLDYTGATAFVGKLYGPGVADALAYIADVEGGIDGTPLEVESKDYAYQVPQAQSLYNQWKGQGMVAMQGWGTADTEALIETVAQDQIPVFSASYSAHLTDPSGKNPATKKPAPYNFFYGPSYSDGCRALVKWAADDAKAKGITEPKFVHTGDNHPYPNAPKEGCAAYAKELGLTVLDPIVVPLKPADFTPQCLTLKESGAHYAYVGNLGGSVVAMVKACDQAGVTAQLLGNVWAGDWKTITAAEAQNYIYVSVGPEFSELPADSKVHKILEHAGRTPEGEDLPTNHYIRGVCSAYFMTDAMKMAKKAGGITGQNIKAALESMTNYVPAGLEGICVPSTWTAEDHRGTTQVNLMRGHFENGKAVIERVATVDLERRSDWLGQ